MIATGMCTMGKEFKTQEGYPNCIIYDSIRECLTDKSDESRDFLEKSRIDYYKFYQGQVLYLCKCVRSNTKFALLNYKNGYFYVENLSIFDKKWGKNESKNEGQYILSYALKNAINYIENCLKKGVFTKRNFHKFVRLLKEIKKDKTTFFVGECINPMYIDEWLDKLYKDTNEAYLQVISYGEKENK